MNMVRGMSRVIAPVLLVLFVTPLAFAQPTGEGAAATHQIEETEPPPAEDEEPVFGEEIELYDPSGHALGSFHAALRRAEAGEDQARVMFYGASHVAADFFTNVVRQRLQARFGDAGHGFLMPARPWRHYRHLGGPTVESNRRWEGLRIRANTREVGLLGVAGMAVESDSRSAWGRIDTGAATANRFVVHFLLRPDGGSFDVRLDGRRVARVSTRNDTIEAGVYRVENIPDARHTLEIRLRGDGPVRFFGVSVEREQAGVIVDTMGLNGARAVSHLLWQEELHQTYLRQLRPDLVVLAYGTNESGDEGHPIDDYEGELRAVVGRLRGTVPDASCLLIGPSDRPMRGEDGEMVDRPRTHQIVEVQRRVSRDFGCAFFDLLEFGGGPLSMVRWAEAEPPFASRDLVHFTGRAYLRLGEVLYARLVEGYERTASATPSR